ncbi:MULTISPECIES: J domain-containing protein [unclassified Caulobacter]|uniref:J domain-containing protein n=1 Tax=unclassified Caulobacter TaxID=2648921 RepID=UPI000D3CA3FA|nr:MULTISPECIES: molecular chaperone DnaJ [unclassified Caulobacter]PTS91925.1 molecular chaperone DnaJ [Caulobacter sp. HMWF009]PTT06470.1 molecular chaperone DnaJ [Caulobacter sp. HMWF025]
MIYLLLGAAVLAFVFWGGRRPLLKGDGWRVGAGVFALVVFAAAAYTTIRGSWGTGIVLGIVGLWSASEARRRPALRRAQPPAALAQSLTEARSILGVGPEATADDIRAAHARLIRLAHPDKGGTAGLAAQLNAARDRLLTAGRTKA